MTSLIHIESLWRFKQNQLEKEIEDFIKEWNKSHRCNCCKNWEEGKMLIECSHVEKEKIKKFKERNLQQFRSIFFLRFIAFNQLIKH